ncbi:tetratricopeptide repeat protein [Aureispira anguillae]|nr:tetratricopeptide repeat protein [Aureispira anguillae]
MLRLSTTFCLFHSVIFFFFFSTVSAQNQLNVQLQKGITAFKKGNFPKAERIFDKLIASESSYAEAYLWKGKCLQEFEEYQAAYEAFFTACNLAPDHAPYWLELGNFKYTLGITSIRKPEACGECGKFLLPDTESTLNPTVYYKSALKDYQKALQLDPQYAEAHYQLGMVYKVLGDLNNACLQVQKAQALKHPKAKQYSAEICP